ncbi:phage virion morphogenesis protein [Zobellia galactanivorans]|uniref:phage virion morphogenesis protein n=1 Tax=Zobellia galactanivorans (strain DSM 12802 / CCUG 47099 / CIP 106680 / NCIMB 13871 / Dsij) TaxID=63186 RepID=UPI0026E2D255|nr:phage virion morphogenesis protein [Zobellia galactanivorans]MDO6808096.1 phage virion morphogenesis protein [Zobellia galactanivorans]
MADLNKIDLYFDRFHSDFDNIVPNIVAETATEFFKNRFVEQEWEGVPWQPLNPAYAAKKTKGRGRILTREGKLVNSIRPSLVSVEKVTISAGNSNVPYARVHNEGLHIKGVRKIRGYTNKNFMGKGKPKKIRAHSRSVDYTMPQRQYMGRSAMLNQLMRARLIAALKSS